MKRFAIIFFSLILSCGILRAQFSLTGSDPGRVRWQKMDTPDFRIIFPEGEDSLARVYGSWLEKAKVATSWSSGMETGEYHRGKLPVILHSFYPLSNASVAWAPKRMDIYTVLDPYSPTPVPWEKLLAFHEGRHASQMQAGEGGRNKVLSYLTGELFAGAAAGIYAGPTLLEGDAVVTETALTESGRGRQASFLQYMVPAFDSGDWRDYWKWSLGSNKFYTPDHYRTGYMLVSGMRVFYNDPLFTSEYFSRVRKGGLFLLKKTVKNASGMNIRKSFKVIEERYHDIWTQEAEARRPFMPSEQVSVTPWRHVSYTGTVIDSEGFLWSQKAGMTVTGALVRTSHDGKEIRARSFATYTSPLAYDPTGGRIYWSESVKDPRWTLGGSARIRYIETSTPSKIHNLTLNGKYYNPAPSPDGALVSATEYPATGGSRIVVLKASDGEVVKIIEAPDSLQFTESAWVDGHLFAAGLSDHGMGIYALEPLRTILGPRPVELSTLRPYPLKPALTFVCDRTGVGEMYLLEPVSGILTQVTSTRYGIYSPAFNAKADTLFYSALAPSDKPEAYRQGLMLYATPAKDLPYKEVSFNDIHKYPVAEALSAQEKALAGAEGWKTKEYSETTFSEPSRYRKLTPTFHSWAPIYFSYDNISKLSADDYYNTASLGATALFQNLIGDGYGSLGYGFHRDPDTRDSWRHSAHLKYLYTGLYPFLEFSADIGDRSAVNICRVQQTNEAKKQVAVFSSGQPNGKPYISSTLRVYIPFSFSSGGLSRGLVPQVKMRLTNDIYNDKISLQTVKEQGAKPEETGILGNDHSSSLWSLDMAVRGYVMREKALSQIFPRLGIGAEIGFRTRPGHTGAFSNTAYLYSYGYLPGILQNQGLKITATMGKDIGGGTYSYPETSVSFVPRGFSETNLGSVLNSCSPEKYKLTFDYAIPLLNLDWSGLCPLVYVKNVNITPFFDYSFLKFNYYSDFHINKNNVQKENLTSVGLDLTFTLGNILWLPFDSQFGVRYARNSWNWNGIENLNVKGLGKDYFNLIFDVSF